MRARPLRRRRPRLVAAAPPRGGSKALRLVAWGVLAAGLALPLARRRLGLHPAATAALAAAPPFALSIALPRSKKRDAAVYALQMWAYILIHELPNDDPARLERRVHVDYPIAVDRILFGQTPTAGLQRILARPGRTTALDHALVFVHWAWFAEPHAAAAWVLWRHPERFPRAATLICAVFDLGVVAYTLVPTAPPWWASEHRVGGAADPPMRRIMADVGERVWGRFWPSMYRFFGGNPLAAMPSLHFATSVMAAHVLDDYGPVPAAVGWGYASVLGFALVYLGEHYVIDLAAGLALAELVRAAEPRAALLLAGIERNVRMLQAGAGA